MCVCLNCFPLQNNLFYYLFPVACSLISVYQFMMIKYKYIRRQKKSCKVFFFCGFGHATANKLSNLTPTSFLLSANIRYVSILRSGFTQKQFHILTLIVHKKKKNPLLNILLVKRMVIFFLAVHQKLNEFRANMCCW